MNIESASEKAIII